MRALRSHGRRPPLRLVALVIVVAAVAAPFPEDSALIAALTPTNGIERAQLGMGCRLVDSLQGRPVTPAEMRELEQSMSSAEATILAEPFMRRVLDTVRAALRDRELRQQLTALCRAQQLPRDFGPPDAPETVVTSGADGGLSWQMTVGEDIDGVCMSIRIGGGRASQCGPKEALAAYPIAASRNRESVGDDPAKRTYVDFVYGSAAPSVVRVVVLASGRRVETEAYRVERIGLAFFAVAVPSGGEATVIGYDASGREVGRWRVPEEPSTGPADG